MKSQGFTDVRIVELETQFNGITITKTEAKHGTDDVLTHFGANFGISMGFIFRAQGEKTVYFTGDTIWIKSFELAVEKYNPNFIVMNAAYPLYAGMNGSSFIGEEDVKKMLWNV